MSNVRGQPSLSGLRDIEKPNNSTDDDLIARLTSSSSPPLIRKIRVGKNGPVHHHHSVHHHHNHRHHPYRDATVINGQNNRNTSSVINSEGDLIADKYQLFEQVIGSSLFRCVDVKTQKELVCKVVSKDNHSLMSAHYRLDSAPSVQSLHEVVVGQRYLYLVFPNAHGDLHSYVRQRKRLRESEARRLFRQIAKTVRLCHRNGIVLRDLKLRKFVFADTEQTQLKLESFEDAVVLDKLDSDWLQDKRGCPAYVSPEILKAGQYSGKAADMWSMGVILYTMLVGRYPFNDAGHANLFARISSGSYVVPECVSPRARCLIRSLLRKEPSERINSEDVLFHPWLTKEDREWVARSCDQTVPESSMYD
ncbi:hypothetical protein ABEB36_011856 [Hypothenemus hampei]|uniref:Protein kinase domain-containing protein n=1 Tax=Hypothenemus hampei TaxID=57062 RepID=A0ABD1E9A8_HYPHA